MFYKTFKIPLREDFVFTVVILSLVITIIINMGDYVQDIPIPGADDDGEINMYPIALLQNIQQQVGNLQVSSISFNLKTSILKSIVPCRFSLTRISTTPAASGTLLPSCRPT